MQNYNPNNNFADVNYQCCCFNLRKITRAVTQIYDHCLEPAGIRSTQFTLLVELATTNAKTLTEIASSLVMDRTTLTRNLKPLEKSGYIKVLPTVDKRTKLYSLTDHGREVVNSAMPLWSVAQSNVVAALGEERYDPLVKELSKLINVSISETKGNLGSEEDRN